MAAIEAEMVARALVAAAAMRGIDPAQVFAKGAAATRILAALAFDQAQPVDGRRRLARAFHIAAPSMLAPSAAAKRGVAAADVALLAGRLARLRIVRTRPALPVGVPPTRREGPPPDDAAVPALSPIRGSRTAGKPAPRKAASPDALRNDPADTAGQVWETRKVAELRGRNTPWAHIAAQLGKPELSLRQMYDPGFAGPAPPASPPPAVARPIWRQVLAALAAGSRTAPSIGVRTGLPSGKVSAHLNYLRQRDFAFSAPAADGARALEWRLTRPGAAEAAKG